MATNNVPVVDTKTSPGYSSTKNGTISSILGARDNTKSASTIQSKNLASTTKSMGGLQKNIDDMQKALEGVQHTKESAKYLKEFNAAIKDFTEAFADADRIVKSGSTNIVELAKTVEKSNNAYDNMKVAYDVMNKVFDSATGKVKELTNAQKKKIEEDKADSRHRKELRARQRQEIIDDAKESSKSLKEAFSSFAKDAQQIVSNIHTAFSLDKLTTSNVRSGAAQIQLDLMKTMDLTRKEFNDFKGDLYGQLNTALYSAEDIRTAIGDLKDLGINNTTEAINKINTLVRGQQLLGMTSEQQAKLQQYGNKVGRDSLTFTTNKMAKWLQMSNNIGTKQLAELVDLNTAFKMEMADLGIRSEAFENTTDAVTAAAVAQTGNIEMAERYTQATAFLASDMTAPAEMLHRSLADFKKQIDAGISTYDMIDDGLGKWGMLYNNLMSNYDHVIGNLPAYTTDQGIDNATAAMIIEQAKYDRQHGRGAWSQMTYGFDVSSAEGAEALKQIEEQQLDATDKVTQTLNEMQNYISEKADWITWSNMEGYMSHIITLLGIIAAADGISALGNIFKGGKNLLGKGTKALTNSKFGKAVASGASKMFGAGSTLGGSAGVTATSWGNGLLATAAPIAAGASIAGGAIWGGVDAYNSVKNADANYGKGHKFGAGVAGFFAGSKVHKDAEGNVSTGKNVGKGALSGAGKGALIGAGIGTFIGGPIGTAIGAGVGALAGGIGGAISGWWKSKKAKEQEQREKDQLAATQDVAKNTAQANKYLSDSKLSTSNRSVASIRSYTGQGGMGAGPTLAKASAKPIVSTNGKGAANFGLPWKITSRFGPRTLDNGDKRDHKGVDFGIPIGTPIGAPISGIVSSTQIDSRNTYPDGATGAGTWVYMQGDDGNIYQFGHLSSIGVKVGDRVTAGQTIALSGNTGYSTGPHLHYGVMVGGEWINPVTKYTTNGLFSADGKMIAVIASNGLDASVASSDSHAENNNVFKTKIRAYNMRNYTEGMGAVVDGLADIKKTLVDLSNRQTRDEQIMSMLQGTKKQEPRTT